MFKLTSSEKSVIYYEAIFAKAIDMFNAKSAKLGKKAVMLSHGKKIYADAIAEYGRMSLDEKAGKSPRDIVINCFDKHISEFVGEKTNWCDWCEKTFGKNLMSNINEALTGGNMPLPISPYAARYPELIARNAEGNKLFLVRSAVGSEITMADLKKTSTYDKLNYLQSNMDYFSNKYNPDKIGDNYIKPCYSTSDKYGLAKLMSHVKKEDFTRIAESIEGYCNNNRNKLAFKLIGVDTSKLSATELKDVYAKTDEAVRKNVYIGLSVIRALNDLGYDYNITLDSQDGQIKANVPLANCSFRVLDISEPEYTGRYYSDGISGYLSPSYKSNPNDKYPGLIFEPTEKDVYNLVRFSLGENVVTGGFRPGIDVVKTNDTGAPIFYPVGQAFSFDRDTMKSGVKKEQRGLSAYHLKDGSSTYVYRNQHINPNSDDYSIRNGHNFGHKVSFRFDGATYIKGVSPITDKDTARNYVDDCIKTAKDNFTAELDPDNFMMDMYDNGAEADFEPLYSEDKLIANIQKDYYDYYTGKTDLLPVPGKDYDDYNKLLEAGEDIPDYLKDSAFYPYTTDSDERLTHIEEHAKLYPEYLIGSLEPDISGETINLAMIARYQQSEMSVAGFINTFSDSLRYLKDDIDVSKFKSRGDDYSDNIVNKSVAFDDKSAVNLKDKAKNSEFMKNVYNTVYGSIIHNGGSVPEIFIDKNGIIKYDFSFSRSSVKDVSRMGGTVNTIKDYEMIVASGYIGQIFEPDKDGLVQTNYASGNNLIFAPGYNAVILPHIDGDTKSVEERTRLLGYEQNLLRNIKQQIRHDMVTAGNTVDKDKIGNTTNVNYTYKQLYTRRYDLDFKKKFREQGMTDEDLTSIIKTEMQKVRYPTEFKNDTTIYASLNAEKYPNFSDSEKSYFNLVDRRNMGILDENSDGYFDPIMTTATSTNQGIVRYLVDGAKVNPDGSITKSEVPNDRCAVMHTDWAKYMEYDPFDRQNMSSSNIAQASAISKPVGVSQMTFNGYNFEDAVIISKDFALDYKMRTEDGSLRPLKKGDKISDMHGNKGVVSLIVDRNMDDSEAENLGIKDAVTVFRNNPDLDVVMAPFSAVGRFNGGTARELMSKTDNLVDHNGEVHEACIGHMRFIITDKSAEAKTHIYASDNKFDDAGRKASSQLAWLLNSKNCKAIMREIYGQNNGSVRDLREYLIAGGLDLSNKGDILPKYTPQADEVRKVFPMPDFKDVASEYTTTRKDGTTGVRRPKELPADYAKQLMTHGGMMEVPFRINFPSVDKDFPSMTRPLSDFYDKNSLSENGYDKITEDSVITESEIDTYVLPVLSAKLRAGLEFDDGDVSIHDYTQKYMDIAMQGYLYTYYDYMSKNKIDMKDINPEFEKVKCKQQAQASYNQIITDISNKKLQGKHNVIKESIMSKRVNKSATAIVTPDPKLRIDEVGVSSELLNKLGKKNGDYILFFRDPLLRNGGVAYLKAVEQPDITGVAINPVRFKPMDGDYDGGARRSIMKSYRVA